MNNHVHSAPQLERKKRTEKKERRITHYKIDNNLNMYMYMYVMVLSTYTYTVRQLHVHVLTLASTLLDVCTYTCKYSTGCTCFL